MMIIVALFCAFFLLSLDLKSSDDNIVTVRHMMWGSAVEVRQVDAWLRDFERENPDIKIKNIHVPRNYPSKLLTMIAGRVPPDIAFCNQDQFSFLASRNVLEEIPLKIAEPEAYFPVLRNIYSWNGKYYGIPRALNCFLIFYNKDIFDQAGIPYPDGNWSFDKFIAIAKELTKYSNDRKSIPVIFGCSFFEGQFGLEFLALNFGGEFVNSSGSFAGYKKANKKACIEALEFNRELVYKYKVAPSGIYVQQNKSGASLFLLGRQAMEFNGTWNLQTARKTKGLNWGIAPPPFGEKHISSMVQSTCYIIPKGGKHKNSAMRLLKYLTSRRINERLASSGRCIPPRIAVMKSDIFRKSKVFPDSTAPDMIEKALNNARSLHYNEKTAQVYDFLNDETSKFMLPEKAVSASEVLDLTNERLMRYNEKKNPHLALFIGFVILSLGLFPFLIFKLVSSRNKKDTDKSPAATSSKKWYAYLFLLPNFTGFLIFTFFPVFASFGLSFCEWDILGPPKFVGLGNFVKLMQDRDFWYFLYNTLFFMMGIPISIAGSLFLAIVLNRKLRLERVFRFIFYLPTITAGVAIFFLWMWLYNNEAGLINTFLRQIFSVLPFHLSPPNWLGSTFWSKPALMIMRFWITWGGVNMILYIAGLCAIDPQLYEAAELDGAGAWKQFLHVTWPMLRPTTFFIVIMSIIQGFQGGFEMAYIMTEGGPAGSTTTLGYYIFNNAYRWFHMGYAASISWVLFIIILIITIIQWKFVGDRTT